ncbi:MAG: glycosyltransferase family 4 protein [Planctomycetia bacterium]|nr:glycosyltransferase family 4 protein [Planctomycetia bacterium]
MPRFIGGGPERHLLALAAAWRQSGHVTEHRLLVLEPPLSAALVVRARKLGIQVLPRRSRADIAAAIEAADVVEICFWNHPLLSDLLREDLPAMRLIVNAAVSGLKPPQVLTAPLGLFADAMTILVAASEQTPAVRAARAAGRTVATIPMLADMTRLDGLVPRPHRGIRVGYLGLVEPTKMHPRFAELSAAVAVPQLRFDIFGDGTWAAELMRRFEALGAGSRVRFHGHTEDLREAFAELDIFGYPLAAETYASSEKTLQEAMWAGIPPVVLAGNGASELVAHERTGLVCDSETDYPRAIERLATDAALRQRLATAARAHARAHFDPAQNALRSRALFEALAGQPRRCREPLPGRGLSAAGRFVTTLGDQAECFEASMAGTPFHSPASVRDADATIASASAVLARGEGGVIHHRNAFPDDPLLRFWSGLIARHAGDDETARADFDVAVAAGLPAWRITGEPIP